MDRSQLSSVALGEAVVDTCVVACVVARLVGGGAPGADVVRHRVAVLVDPVRSAGVGADLGRGRTHGHIRVVAVAHGHGVAVAVGVEVLVRDPVTVVVDPVVGLELARVDVGVLVVAVQRAGLVDRPALGDVREVAIGIVVVRLTVVHEVVAVVVPRVAGLRRVGVDEGVTVVAVPLLDRFVASDTLTQLVQVAIGIDVSTLGREAHVRDLDVADADVLVAGRQPEAATGEHEGEEGTAGTAGQVEEGQNQLHDKLQQADGLGCRTRNSAPFRERIGIGPIKEKVHVKLGVDDS